MMLDQRPDAPPGRHPPHQVKPTLRLLTWNLQVRRDCAAQVAAVARLRPDIAAFQEVNARSWAALSPLLREAGLAYRVAGPERVPEGGALRLRRFVAVASRWPLATLDGPALPAPECVVGVRAATPLGAIDVVAVYIPMVRYGITAATQEGVAEWMASMRSPHHVMLGDLNSPRAETLEGDVIPFTRPSHPRYAAELGLVKGLRGHGMRDAFRFANGYAPRDTSWSTYRKGREFGFRIDHIFVSSALDPVACWYDHESRLARLSDHAPMVADVALREG